MTVAAAAGFSLAMTVLAASPGPGVFGVVGRSLSSGVGKTIFMIAGIVTGDLIYLIFAIFGLTYAAQNLSGLFHIVRMVGGAYLVFVGLKTFFAQIPEDEGDREKKDAPALSVYLSGLLITLSNPKVILFYCGFLPAFTNLESLTLGEGGFIVLAVMTILSTVMYLYARLASTLGGLIKTPKGAKVVNRSVGGIMASAGALMILKK